ncbi:MAG: hypothetical protein V1866_04920 [archaeon]
MEKILAVLISALLLALVVVGCSETAPTKEAAQPTDQSGDASATVQGDGSISGAIVSTDSLGSELSDPDLQDVDAQLNEIDW